MHRIYLTKTGLDRQYVGPTFTTRKEALAWKSEPGARASCERGAHTNQGGQTMIDPKHTQRLYDALGLLFDATMLHPPTTANQPLSSACEAAASLLNEIDDEAVPPPSPDCIPGCDHGCDNCAVAAPSTAPDIDDDTAVDQLLEKVRRFGTPAPSSAPAPVASTHCDVCGGEFDNDDLYPVPNSPNPDLVYCWDCMGQ